MGGSSAAASGGASAASSAASSAAASKAATPAMDWAGFGGAVSNAAQNFGKAYANQNFPVPPAVNTASSLSSLQLPALMQQPLGGSYSFKPMQFQQARNPGAARFGYTNPGQTI